MKRIGISYKHLLGWRFAVNVFIAASIVWFSLRFVGVKNPIWAIASMVAASDPQPDEARRMFKGRLINVLVGCAVGLLFLLVGGMSEWMLPLALACTVLISTYLVRVKTMWRQGPITAAIVIASELTYQSTRIGLEQGLRKVTEVIFGCVVGTFVSLFMARLWLVQPTDEEDTGG
jgi:uncharacterized membrane protein YccC